MISPSPNLSLPVWLEKNLKVLQEKVPDFARMVEKKLAGITQESIEFELARSGDPVAKVSSPVKNKLWMHSRYEPRDEAEKFIQAQGELGNLILAFGFGNGYHIREILKVMPEDGRLIIVGLNPELVCLSFKYLDLTDIFSDPRVRLMIDDDIDRLAEFYYQSLDWKTVRKVSYVVHGPSEKLYPETYKRFFEKVRYLTRQSQGNLMTIMKNGTEFQDNTLKNLKNFIMTPGVKGFFDMLQGKFPAILVSAGPSLDKNVHLLKELKGKVMIIATDTALKPLISHGTEPDIVVAADPCYLNSLDFQGLPKVDSVLVAEPMASPDIFRWHSGPKVVCSFGDVVVRWMETYTEEKGVLFAWGSISTTAFDLARKMGADPIIFIGQDLSFPFGKTHCKGTFHDERYQRQSDYWNSFEMKFTQFSARGKRRLLDINGQEVLADEQYNIYRQWFENQIERTKAKLVNATEGGVLTKGYTVMTFRAAIDEFCQESFPVKEKIQEALKQTGEIKLDSLHLELFTLKKMLTGFETEIKEVLGLIKKLERHNDSPFFPKLKGKEREWFLKIVSFADRFLKAPCLSFWYSNVHQKEIHRFYKKFPIVPTDECEIKVKDFVVGYRELSHSFQRFVQNIQPITLENFTFVDEALQNFVHLQQEQGKNISQGLN